MEVRLDGGDWIAVVGTTAWSHEIDTTQMPSGLHKVEVRSFDGERFSRNSEVIFEVDQPPGVHITAPTDSSVQKKGFILHGSASDDVNVTKVEVRLDGGDWMEATGTTTWSWDVSTKGLEEGEHSLEVRAFDGFSYSDETTLEFAYKKPVDNPGATSILAFVALMVAIGLILQSDKRKRY